MSVNNLRTKRDNQQWMLDLALNMRGRVQNFERDDWETPKRAHNYRMLPKMWRQKAEHDEALGKQAQEQGFDATAAEHYDHAIETYPGYGFHNQDAVLGPEHSDAKRWGTLAGGAIGATGSPASRPPEFRALCGAHR